MAARARRPGRRYVVVLDDGQPLGVLSFHDVAWACLKEANFENSLLKRYIRHWPESG